MEIDFRLILQGEMQAIERSTRKVSGARVGKVAEKQEGIESLSHLFIVSLL